MKRTVIIIKQQPQTNLYPFPLSVEYDETEGQLSVIALPFVGSYSLFLNDDTLANVQEFSSLPQSWQFDSTVLWEVNTAILTTHAVDGQTDTDSVYRLVFNLIADTFVPFPLIAFYHPTFTLPYPTHGKGYNPSSWPIGASTDSDFLGVIDTNLNMTKLTLTHFTYPTWYPSNSYPESGDIVIGRMRDKLAINIPQFAMPNNPTFSLDDGDATQGQIWFTLIEGKGIPLIPLSSSAEIVEYPNGLYGQYVPTGQALNDDNLVLYGNYYYYSFQVRTIYPKLPSTCYIGFCRPNNTFITNYAINLGNYVLIQGEQIAVIGCYIDRLIIDNLRIIETNGFYLNCVGMEFV